MNRRAQWAAVAAMAAVGTAGAAPAEFDFADPKGVNGVQLLLDNPIEPIVATAGGVSGKVRFDPAAPEKLSGAIEVRGEELQFVNPMMAKVARGADWLNVDAHPDLRFEVREVLQAAPGDASGHYRLKVRGDFECRGVTKPLTVDVDLRYLPGRMGDRVPKTKGDLLVLRTSFTVKRTDFGLKQDPDFLHVADEVQVRVGIVGSAPVP